MTNEQELMKKVIAAEREIEMWKLKYSKLRNEVFQLKQQLELQNKAVR